MPGFGAVSIFQLTPVFLRNLERNLASGYTNQLRVGRHGAMTKPAPYARVMDFDYKMVIPITLAFPRYRQEQVFERVIVVEGLA